MDLQDVAISIGALAGMATLVTLLFGRDAFSKLWAWLYEQCRVTPHLVVGGMDWAVWDDPPMRRRLRCLCRKLRLKTRAFREATSRYPND